MTKDLSSRSYALRFLEIIIVAGVYFFTARLGQTLAIPPGNVTPVWIPSGVMLAAVFIRGYQIWPGIFLGAFVGNVWAYIDFSSMIILLKCIFTGTANGIGDVLSTAGAAWMIEKQTKTKFPLYNVRHIVTFLVLGVIAGPFVSALFGVTTLCMAGVIPWPQYLYTLLTWWTGDGVGALIIAPFIMAWFIVPRPKKQNVYYPERISFWLILLSATAHCFRLLPESTAFHLPMFSLATLLIWASFRFGYRSTLLAVLLVACMAIGATAMLKGTFSGKDLNVSLTELQWFLGVMAITTLILKGTINEWQVSKNELRLINETLETHVDQRTDELILANEKLANQIKKKEEVQLYLLESEAKYHGLISEMNAGFALHEMIYDPEGQPCDYRFLEINDQFEKMTGLSAKDIVGKTVLELLPQTESYWVNTYGKVVKTGKPVVMENYSKELEKHFSVLAYTASKDQFATIINDVTDKKKYEHEIKKALSEKETLLKELYHRTKNNMQMIISLINLQTQDIDDQQVQKIFLETKNRINSMALVHEKLYQTRNLSKIDLSRYFKDLIHLLRKSYRNQSQTVNILTDFQSIMVKIDTAITCGLVMNELISNAFKYAFDKMDQGEIKIELHHHEKDHQIYITFKDNGPGLPEGMRWRDISSMGLKTIIALVEEQLAGSIELDQTDGLKYQIIFREDAE